MGTGGVTHRGVVYPRDLDHMGHMNVVAYTAHFDEATWNFFADIGLAPSYLREAGRALAAARYEITYERELLAGDIVTVRSRLTRVGSSSLTYVHEMSNGETGELVATAEVVGVLIDRETRRSTPFPPQIAEKLRALVP